MFWFFKGYISTFLLATFNSLVTIFNHEADLLTACHISTYIQDTNQLIKVNDTNEQGQGCLSYWQNVQHWPDINLPDHMVVKDKNKTFWQSSHHKNLDGWMVHQWLWSFWAHMQVLTLLTFWQILRWMFILLILYVEFFF